MERTVSLQISSLIETFLFVCIGPAFVWSIKEKRILKKNIQAETFLNDKTGKSLNEIDKLFINWSDIPLNDCHSMWLSYVDRNQKKKNIQVRNVFLDKENDLVGTVIVENNYQEKNSGIEKTKFIYTIESLFNKMSSSPADFLNSIELIEEKIAAELSVKEFIIIPLKIMGSAGLSTRLIDHLNRYESGQLIQKNLSSILPCEAYRLIPFQTIDSTASKNSFLYFFNSEENPIGAFFLEQKSLPEKHISIDLLSYLSNRISQIVSHLNLLHENEQYMNTAKINMEIIENISEGVIITDDQFIVQLINKTASSMFGFSNTKVVGHKLSDLLVTSDGLKGIIDSQNKGGMINYLHRRSGQIFPCNIHYVYAVIDENHPPVVVFFLTDKTETEESRLKAEQLSQRAFLGDFASMLSHEIRNPINNMKVWVRNLIKIGEGNNDVINAATRIEGDCLRISQLVDNILAFSKPISLNKEIVDLSLLISEVLEKWKLNFARSSITAYFAPPQNFPKISADPRTLEQVFNNIIGNSVDALDNKSGIITFKLDIEKSESGQNQIVITESDNGPGIPDDKIDHIFEPFMTTKKNGNGWGLALTKRIINSHQGTIQVKSFPGGTMFEILLPLTEKG